MCLAKGCQSDLEDAAQMWSASSLLYLRQFKSEQPVCPGNRGQPFFVPCLTYDSSIPWGGVFSECLGKKDCLECSLSNDLVHRGYKVRVLTICSVCFPTACTDKELRNLASRLKDWFGALHEDANRVIKPTSSDTAQGSKTTLFLLFHTKYPSSQLSDTWVYQQHMLVKEV